MKQRFLGAVTHMGTLTLYETVQAQCTRVYELSDRYGLAHPLLSRLLAGAVLGGYDVVACPDPMAPERLAHLLVPEAGLAFVSSAPASPYPGKCCRRLRLETMADQEALRRCRPRLRFSLKVSAALVEEAVDSLAQAKTMHDGLEAPLPPLCGLCQGGGAGRADRRRDPGPGVKNGDGVTSEVIPSPDRMTGQLPGIKSRKARFRSTLPWMPGTVPVWVYCHISKS